MFSMEEKKKLSAGIEKLLLELNHPEMPTDRPLFHLHVTGKEAWSWADIKPNWTFAEAIPEPGRWNEGSREIMG